MKIVTTLLFLIVIKTERCAAVNEPCSQEGEYFMHADTCGKYVKCSNLKIRSDRQCPPNLHFDHKRKTCSFLGWPNHCPGSNKRYIPCTKKDYEFNFPCHPWPYDFELPEQMLCLTAALNSYNTSTKSVKNDTWTNIRRNCQEIGGDIVVFSDERMKKIVSAKFQYPFWLGLRLRYASNKYEWIGDMGMPDVKQYIKARNNQQVRNGSFGCVTTNSSQDNPSDKLLDVSCSTPNLGVCSLPNGYKALAPQLVMFEDKHLVNSLDLGFYRGGTLLAKCLLRGKFKDQVNFRLIDKKGNAKRFYNSRTYEVDARRDEIYGRMGSKARCERLHESSISLKVTQDMTSMVLECCNNGAMGDVACTKSLPIRVIEPPPRPKLYVNVDASPMYVHELNTLKVTCQATVGHDSALTWSLQPVRGPTRWWLVNTKGVVISSQGKNPPLEDLEVKGEKDGRPSYDSVSREWLTDLTSTIQFKATPGMDGAIVYCFPYNAVTARPSLDGREDVSMATPPIHILRRGKEKSVHKENKDSDESGTQMNTTTLVTIVIGSVAATYLIVDELRHQRHRRAWHKSKRTFQSAEIKIGSSMMLSRGALIDGKSSGVDDVQEESEDESVRDLYSDKTPAEVTVLKSHVADSNVDIPVYTTAKMTSSMLLNAISMYGEQQPSPDGRNE